MTSVKDVAAIAKVSTATVSRVLNKKRSVRDDLRRRVEQAIELLNYQPNGVARSLRQLKTQTIGVLLPDVSNPYYMRMLGSLETRMRNFNYDILVGSTHDNLERENNLLTVFLEKKVDALILATSAYFGSINGSGISVVQIPVVLVDRVSANFQLDAVVEDNEPSAYKLVRFLIDRGHENIAMISGDPQISTVFERENGYRRAIEEIGLTPEIRRGKYDKESGYVSAKELLIKRKWRPTAVVCANNDIAVGVLIAVREYSINIPEDLSLVCFGEIPLQELIEPKLTCIVQDPEMIGRVAADILVRRLYQGLTDSPEKIVLQTVFRVGNSVRNLKWPN